MEFAGFGSGARRFLRELAAHNDREWFRANQERYEREVLEPAAAFVEELGPRLARIYPALNYDTRRNGSGSIMRIHRDVRFSPDKRPYKENLGIVLWIGDGKKVELPCFYLHLAVDSAFFYGGQHMMPKPVLERYRAAAADERTGAALAKTLDRLGRAGYRILEEPAYKKVPRGFPADHPRAALLKYAGLGVGMDLDAAALASPELPEVCAGFASKASALMAWLAELNG